jgi:hypothetical protein
MGQLPIQQCKKCECFAVSSNDWEWTKYCNKCYLDMSSSISNKLCEMCTISASLPKFRRMVEVYINDVAVKECFSCGDNGYVSYDSRRKFCDRCIERMCNTPPNACKCGQSLH